MPYSSIYGMLESVNSINIPYWSIFVPNFAYEHSKEPSIVLHSFSLLMKIFPHRHSFSSFLSLLQFGFQSYNRSNHQPQFDLALYRLSAISA